MTNFESWKEKITLEELAKYVDDHRYCKICPASGQSLGTRNLCVCRDFSLSCYEVVMLWG